jgi:large subunit ribosomal protein L32
MRANRSKTGMRRSHQAIAGARVSLCECGAQRVSHRACPSCGKYNGRVIIDVVARAKRDQRRTKRREKALRESGQLSESKEPLKT